MFSSFLLRLGWSSVVRMGQIDCTHSDNRAICGLYHIQAFPTIKVRERGEREREREGEEREGERGEGNN